jgi:hypothetical protein
MSNRANMNQRLVSVFLLGCLLFTYPLLALFNSSDTVLGIPMLYTYLFGAWAVLIVLMAIAVARKH